MDGYGRARSVMGHGSRLHVDLHVLSLSLSRAYIPT